MLYETSEGHRCWLPNSWRRALLGMKSGALLRCGCGKVHELVKVCVADRSPGPKPASWDPYSFYKLEWREVILKEKSPG